jgi:hypothetical protein
MMQDRSQGWRGLIVLALAIALLLTVTTARADDRPHLDCQTVRAYVAQHGIVVAYARALAAGYSPAEIRKVRKRCGV